VGSDLRGWRYPYASQGFPDLLRIGGLDKVDLWGKRPCSRGGQNMEAGKKFKHHLVRRHNQIGTKTIKVFRFNDFVAAKTECDLLNEKAAETNPAFRFEVITIEVK
jgi:hypothetical protein